MTATLDDGSEGGRSGGEGVDHGVKGGAGAHHRAGLGGIRCIVAADVGRLALDGIELVDDLLLVLGQRSGDGGEVGLQLRVLGLRGERLGPVHGQVEMAAAVVQLARLGRG